jgi:hypothetical protein
LASGGMTVYDQDMIRIRTGYDQDIIRIRTGNDQDTNRIDQNTIRI